VQTLSDFADVAQRAAYLLALAVAPPALSPAPVLDPGPVPTALAIALLSAVVVAAGRTRVRLGGLAGNAVGALMGTAVIAALVGADLSRGDRGPLGRVLIYVAVPLWAGIAVVVGTLAARRGVRTVKIAAALVAASGAFVAAWSLRWLSSPERMWWEALARNGEDAASLDALTRADVRAKRYDAALAVAGRCIEVNPRACACHALRVDVASKSGAGEAAIAEAYRAREACPVSRAVRAASVEALATWANAAQAEQEARASLQQGEDGRLHYALAIANQRLGRPREALEEAKRAVKLGAGRDAALYLALVAINAGDLDAAAEALAPVVAADPGDGDALYDLALVADRRNDYNGARQGYLAALRADPKLAAARHNLVWLTLRAGAIDEARHHAERFAASFPEDPRGASLAKLVADASSQAGPR
jgi:tetratricopeptide (TPR) repeat protein